MNKHHCRCYLSRLRSLLLTGLLMMFLVNEAGGQADRRNIREGNRNFRDGRFSESEIAYHRASGVKGGTPDAWFNLGTSIFRQQRYDDAVASFEKNISLDDDAAKRSNAFYNIGNSQLSAGKVQESIDSYKRSLRLNPSNLEAKYNLAYAQDLLRQQQEDQENQDNQDNQEEEENDNKDSENNDRNNQNEKNQNQEQQQQQQQQAISPEDARRLLEAMAEEEKKLQEKVKKDKAAASLVRTLKNW